MTCDIFIRYFIVDFKVVENPECFIITSKVCGGHNSNTMQNTETCSYQYTVYFKTIEIKFQNGNAHEGKQFLNKNLYEWQIKEYPTRVSKYPKIFYVRYFSSDRPQISHIN